MQSPGKRILILGGGFGGVYAALRLEKLLTAKLASGEVEVCLVSQDNFFLFTPMLHEIAASDLETTNIVNPLRKLLRRTRVLVGEVNRIDLPSQTVFVSRGYQEAPLELAYAHLVLALGSVTNYFNLPGLTELALAMKCLPDAIQLRTHMIQRLERASSESHLENRRSFLTFVVAGGGFAGVETVAALNDFVREALRYYPSLSEEMVRVVLVHPGAVILPELGESLGRYAQQVLEQRGVEIVLNTKVTSMTESEVVLAGNVVVPASTLVWTAGTIPNPLLSKLPCARERGRVVVNPFLQLPEWPNVWAAGDCALVPDVKRAGKFHPPTAQHAIREGVVAAQNIAATLSGRAPKAFSFRTIGLLASIGRRRGVARLLGFNLSGFFAWWLWRTIYLGKLPGLDKKVRVAFEWTLDLLFRKDVCAINNHPRQSSEYDRDERQKASGQHSEGEPQTARLSPKAAIAAPDKQNN